MRVSIIVATGKNREIGKTGKLLWHISAELKRFKEITMGHPMIMGRKTFESIGRPLPGRTSIVITRGKGKGESEVTFVNSLDQGIEEAKKSPGSEEIFIIGGGQIYSQTLPFIDRIYLTLVDASFDADTFFPDYSDFKKVISESDWQQDENLRYKFYVLEK